MNDRGYPAVAKFIAQDPDHETFVFHRFDLLTARNLLNLQSELVALQQDLVALDKEANSGSDPDLALSLRSWRIMEDKAQSNDKVRESLNLAIKLEHKLKKYREFLCQHTCASSKLKCILKACGELMAFLQTRRCYYRKA